MRILFYIATILFLSSCISPGVNIDGAENGINGRHWFESLVHDQATPLSYISPKQPLVTQYSHIVSDSSSQINEGAQPILSSGDRIRLWMPLNSLFVGVFNENNSEFDNVYEIGLDGAIRIPYLGAVSARGLTLNQLESSINQRLVERNIFKKGMAHTNISVVEWAPVNVYVSGSVFNPGQVMINVRNVETRKMFRDNHSGDYPLERMITTALKSAGGIRPDADVRNIEVIRNNKVHSIDLSGVVLGFHTGSFSLIEGDTIRVNSVGTPQVELIQPSAITPPGVRVFISNLTRPAMHNTGSSIGKESTSIPYGSRLLTAAVQGNCVGGAVSTNSDRLVVLITQDPISRKPIAVERRVEDLLRAPYRLDLNPFVMPHDNVVCYDSRVTNLREISNTIGDIVFPFSWLLRTPSPW